MGPVRSAPSNDLDENDQIDLMNDMLRIGAPIMFSMTVGIASANSCRISAETTIHFHANAAHPDKSAMGMSCATFSG